MLPTKFQFLWPNGFIEEEFKKSAIQKKELPSIKNAHSDPIR
jgi:hypothetical protein